MHLKLKRPPFNSLTSESKALSWTWTSDVSWKTLPLFSSIGGFSTVFFCRFGPKINGFMAYFFKWLIFISKNGSHLWGDSSRATAHFLVKSKTIDTIFLSQWLYLAHSHWSQVHGKMFRLKYCEFNQFPPVLHKDMNCRFHFSYSFPSGAFAFVPKSESAAAVIFIFLR